MQCAVIVSSSTNEVMNSSHFGTATTAAEEMKQLQHKHGGSIGLELSNVEIYQIKINN